MHLEVERLYKDGGMYLHLFLKLNTDVISHSRIRTFTPFIIIPCLLLLVSGCITTPLIPTAQSESEKIYTPAQIREDLIFLDQSLKHIHPEPFARLNPDTYDSHFQQLYQDKSWSQRRHEFYRLITPLISKFSDMHTRVLYPQQEYNQFLEQFGKFPLAVLYSSDGLIVVADQQQPSIVPVGSKLLAINSIDINVILDKFSQYVPAETESGQRRMIQMEFSRLLWSIYHLKNNYQVDYLWQGKAYRKVVQGVKQRQTENQHNVVSHYGSISINDQTSLIWLNDFNEQYDKFEQFLDQEFQLIRNQNKQSLILDLRYNQGGVTDNLALLLTYLTKQPVHWANRATVKLSKAFRQQHAQMLENAKNQKYGNYLDWLPMEYMNLWQWEILFTSDGDLMETEIDPVISEKEDYFTGKIYVLSNGYCYSACASVIATLQQNQRATIIGEQPGSLTNVQYGYPVQVELPNTGLKLIIPAMKFILNEDAETNQIMPEHQIERRRSHVLSGQDPVFELAMKLSTEQ